MLKVVYDVNVKPRLLMLQDESLSRFTPNVSRDVKVDICARYFWIPCRKSFFDIRIFCFLICCHRELPLEAAHRRNEQNMNKSRASEERIQIIDQSYFIYLVFMTLGKYIVRTVGWDRNARRSTSREGTGTVEMQAVFLPRSSIVCLFSERLYVKAFGRNSYILPLIKPYL